MRSLPFNPLSAVVTVEEILTKREVQTKLIESSPSRLGVHLMFDRIARRYDLLNRLLSFGQDMLWRRKAVSYLSEDSHAILDLACGTADLALAAGQKQVCHRVIIGLDMAPKMLQLARTKIVRRNLEESIKLLQGDGGALPFLSGSFDAVMIAFGIRNMVDTEQTLGEIHRVLRVGGRAIILEFSQPRNLFLRGVYLLHLRLVVPLIGGLISGDGGAYRYLDRTIETYHQGEEFLRLMSRQGFEKLQRRPLTFGVATIYAGEKA